MPDYIWILSRNSYEGSLKQRPCRLQDRIQPDEISGVLWLFAEHSVLGWPMCRGSLEFQGSNAESVSGIMSPNFCLSNFLSGHRAIHDLWQDTICTEFKGAVLELEALDFKAMRPHLHLFWNVAAFMQKSLQLDVLLITDSCRRVMEDVGAHIWQQLLFDRLRKQRNSSEEHRSSLWTPEILGRLQVVTRISLMQSFVLYGGVAHF